MNDEKLKKILTRDALAEVEKMTGASYKTSEFTTSLGFLNHIEAVADRRQAMLATDDTLFSDSVERYLRIAQKLGFKVVLEIPFTGHGYGDVPTSEKLYFLWRDGILLKFDTYRTTGVNSADFYYNWRPTTKEREYGITSSGCGHEDGIWAGHHDGREGLAFHLRQLEANGEFLKIWKHPQFLWFLHYMDTRDAKGESTDKYDYNAINAARFAMLPDEVRAAILLR
jgi:hypothetical protein